MSEKKTENLHKKKRTKNLTILFMIFVWCAVIWLLTMVKIANAHDVHDLERSYLNGRTQFLESVHERDEKWETRANNYSDSVAGNPERWWKDWHDRLVPDDTGPPHTHEQETVTSSEE